MDTDSFIIHVKTDGFYLDITNDTGKWFDTSGYSKDTNKPVSIGKNKKVIGKFKDELNGDVMIETTNVRAKLYSFPYENSKGEIIEKKKAKGTKKCITKNELTHQCFKDAIFNKKITKRKQLQFRSDHHNIFTEEINKIATNPFDNKRIMAKDKSYTY